jgi:hypothetical protein
MDLLMFLFFILSGFLHLIPTPEPIGLALRLGRFQFFSGLQPSSLSPPPPSSHTAFPGSGGRIVVRLIGIPVTDPESPSLGRSIGFRLVSLLGLPLQAVQDSGPVRDLLVPALLAIGGAASVGSGFPKILRLRTRAGGR